MIRERSPLEAFRAAVESRWGSLTDLTPIIGGQESETYSFLSGTRHYILRLNGVASGFELDAFAHRRFDRPRLPIPEILEIGTLDEMGCYCISERKCGTTLESLSALELGPVLTPVADVLDEIKLCDLGDLSGYGPLSASGTARHPSWRDFLVSICDDNLYEWDITNRWIGSDQRHRLLSTLVYTSEFCPETRNLVHGDFGSNNVLTDGRQVTGVLDWSEAMIGDSLYDIANIFYWRTWLRCMEHQARHFKSRFAVLPLPHVQERLLCYQLRIGLREIYANAVAEDAVGTAWAISRCNELHTLWIARGMHSRLGS